MKYHEVTDRTFLYFSRWSRKGYAVFVSLGREVKIARLPLHMYSIVQLKSLAKGLIVNMDHVSEAVLSVLEKKIQAFLGMEQKGEIYPDGNCVSVNCKGYIARWAVYPFFNYYSRCVV